MLYTQADLIQLAQAQPSSGTTYKIDVPDKVRVDVGDRDSGGGHSYLVIGLGTAVVIALLLLIVLLSRSSGTTTEIHHHHS